MSPAKDLAVVAVVCVGLTAIVLGPSFWVSGPVLLGHPNLDSWSHAWGLDWFLSMVTSLRLPWEIVGAAHPEARVLWYVDPLGALLVLPVWLVGTAAHAYNALQAVQLCLAAASGVALGRAFGGRGWLTAAAAVAMPMLQTEVWNGVVEACWLAPVGFAGALAARRSRWTGLMVGLAGMSTPYLGVGAALLAGTLLAMGGLPSAGAAPASWRARVVDLAIAGALAAALAVPHTALIAASFETDQPFVARPLFAGFNEPTMRINAVDPRAYLMPGDFWSVPANDSVLSAPWKHTPYLGLTVLALLPVGLWRRPRLAVLLLPSAVALVASLGYFLWYDGAFLTDGRGWRYQLPLAWLAQVVEVNFEHHLRFAAMPTVVFAAIADRGVGRFGALVAPVVLFEALVLAPNCWPLPVGDARLPEVYAQLPADGRAVIDLPADSGFGNRTNVFLYYQTLHHRPVPWVNKVGSMGTASMNPALRTWVLLSNPDTPQPGAPGVPDPDADLGAAVRELSDQGFGWVVLHPDYLLSKEQLTLHQRSLGSLLGQPRRMGQAWVWKLPDP